MAKRKFGSLLHAVEPDKTLKNQVKVSSIAAILLLCLFVSAPLFGSCSSPANAIEAENCLPGTPQSDWDVSGAGDPSIQGFATDISVNVGQTISFKIKTDAAAYTIDIYRMGYYGGKGARLVASVNSSVPLPQTQPACLTDASTGLVDCGNWAISASWAVPASAVSGIYFAHLIRTDTGGDSHIVFIVRNDGSNSAILFQTADETWEAYNGYGGSSLYGPDNQFDLSNRAFKVSYNRPFDTRGFTPESATWVFGAEYPMVRFLEANGYDVSYFTGIDAARRGSLILNHKIYVAAGHDEYWSGPHRANVEQARDAGVNMAFFTGNEVFWKTRLEPSIDGSNTPNRTLVCYKETIGPTSNPPATAAVDPADPPIWTGTWRDPSKSPPADGGRPENSLTGTLFAVNGPASDNNGTLSIKVPYADGQMRFWRNTTVASLTSGSTATLPKGTLGYEWDIDADNGFRPSGLFDLSTATYKLTSDLLLDNGGTYGAGSATHHLTMYRAPSGALVFGAGTVQWSWGLDNNHDNAFFSPNAAPSTAMRQATINLFADMGVQPATLLAGLVPASVSTDTVPPTSTITWPSNGTSISGGSTVSITGTAVDAGGGLVAGVEVSTDGGSSWHPATGRQSWTYSWNPSSLGNFTLKSRAVDDSGNLEPSAASASVVTVNPPDCPCGGWSATSTPGQVDSGDSTAGEFGVRFRADFDGFITGIRFYKGSKNTGTHIGNLWSNTGTLLGRAVFSNETASGWQQVSFASPIPVTANTTYVASYFAPVGHYSVTTSYFGSESDSPPLHFLQDGIDGANGVFSYSSTSIFPSSTFKSSNYWVDVVFVPASSMPGAPPALLVQPSTLNFSSYIGQSSPSAQNVSVYNEGEGVLDWNATSNATWLSVSPSGSTPGSLSVSVNSLSLAVGSYTGTITVSSSGATNPPQTISVTLIVTNLLLSDDFSDGTMNGWAFSPLGLASNWNVANGSLQYNGGGHTQVFSGSSGWNDYDLSVGIKLSTLNDYPGGIRGRVNLTTGASYAAWLYPAEGLIRLFRTNAWNIDSGATLLGAGAAAFDLAKFHTVKLSFHGSQIQVFYDGSTVISATDSALASGAIALDVSNQAIGFTNVAVTSANASNNSLAADPSALSFSANWNSINPAPQNVQLSATNSNLVWTATTDAAWLSLSPSFGTTPATVQASVTLSNLSPGVYSGTITLTSLGATNVSQVIPVVFTVTAPPPILAATPLSLSFVSITGQPINSQTLTISNGGFGAFSWSASADSSWLQVSPANGSTPENVSVSVTATGLRTGSYSGNVIVTATGVSNSPLSVPVTLQVLSQDLQETFADQGLGWIVSPMGLANGWTVANGVYSYGGLGLSQACAGNSSWTDYTFDTTVQLSNLSNWPGGVRGRVNPSTGAGYAVWLYPALNELVLYRAPQWNINGPGLVQLASAPLTFDTVAHDLQINFSGSTISVSWDGVLLISAADTTYGSGFVCMDADNQPVSYSNVKVAAVQSQAAIDVPNPASLVFNAAAESLSAPQTVSITAGGANTTWAATSDVPWLGLQTSNGLTPGTLKLTANATGLGVGTYSGTITVSVPGASNSSISIPVTLAVKSAVLSAAPTSLTFFSASGVNSDPQTVQVTNVGTGPLNWTANATTNWLGLNPTSGTAPGLITVSPNASISGVGSFSDAITISSPDAGNSPVTIPVSMQVGSLLFEDTFDNGTGNWTISPLGHADGWTVANGIYTYNGGGHTQSFAGSSNWADYTVATDFQLASLSDYPGGLRARVNTTTGASYGVWIYPAERVLKLFRIDQWNIDAGNTPLAQSGPISIDTNWHNLRLVLQGPTISVYYDNALVINASDATYPRGAVALDVSNQPILFDNVRVISLP